MDTEVQQPPRRPCARTCSRPEATVSHATVEHLNSVHDDQDSRRHSHHSAERSAHHTAHSTRVVAQQTGYDARNGFGKSGGTVQEQSRASRIRWQARRLCKILVRVLPCRTITNAHVVGMESAVCNNAAMGCYAGEQGES